MIPKFVRLEFELFTKPSKSDILRVHQSWHRNGNITDEKGKTDGLKKGLKEKI
jgi:hypothetical protein